MRYVTMPRWIYYMLIVMGIGFAAGAVPFWLFVPVSGHFVALLWVAMGAGFVFFSVRALVSRREDEQIAHTGAAATATVLDAAMTGMFINNVPQWKLRLRIDGYGASYETTLKLLTFTPPSNGSTFSVRIDPARKEHVVFADDDTAGSAGTTSMPAGGGVNVPGLSAQVEATMLAALKKAGLAESGTTAVTNPDGSRTITSTTFSTNGASAGTGATPDAAETVKLLADLDRMHASGALGDAEFDALKRKLLGES